MRRLAVVFLFGAVLATSCTSDPPTADVEQVESDAAAETDPVDEPAPEPEPEPEVQVFARASIRDFRVAEDDLGLGSEFDELFVQFAITVENHDDREVVGVEGALYLVDPFGDRSDGISFDFLQNVPPGERRLELDLGIRIKRFECGPRDLEEWCQAVLADFNNFSVETEILRVAFDGGDVVELS